MDSCNVRRATCDVTPLVLHPRLLCKRPRRRLLLRRETFGDFDLHLDILVPSPAVLLDPLPREAEPLAVLRAGRHPEHHAPAVERLHLDPRAQHRLGEVDRHRADDVQALAPKEPIGLDLDYDHHVSPALGTLSLQAEPRSILRARRHGDHQALLNADFPAPSARRAPLRGNPALAAADGAGAIHGKAALSERDEAATPAFWAGGEGCPGRRAAAAAGGTDLGHRQRHRHPAPKGCNAERDRDRRLDLVLVVRAPRRAARPCSRPPPPPPPPTHPAPAPHPPPPP